jgi:hypothetical protein
MLHDAAGYTQDMKFYLGGQSVTDKLSICEEFSQASGRGWTYVVYGQFLSISCFI